MTACCDGPAIGQITDENILEKIKNFDAECRCFSYKLEKAKENEIPDYGRINIEVSLACQANCAMCSVNAPNWRGQYNYYDQLDQLLNKVKPSKLMLQGGEVLIQKRTMEWLEKYRERNPNVQIHLITNGSVGLEMLDRVEKIFDLVAFSFVGFSHASYKKTMGLELEKTKRFAEELISRANIMVNLKYLITPVDFHESDVFLSWAMNLKPNAILFFDIAGTTVSYINRNTKDQFWDKIIERTANEFKEVLASKRDYLFQEGVTTRIIFYDSAVQLFGIDQMFVNDHSFQDRITLLG